jgi:hypothetical protein
MLFGKHGLSSALARGIMRRLLILPVLIIFSLSHLCAAKAIKLRGYVTAVNSPTTFEMDDYKISDQTSPSQNGKAGVEPLKPVTLRVGLEIEGDYNASTGEVRANEIKALSDEANVVGSGLVEDKTLLQKNDRQWSGTLIADGETLAIAQDTLITVKRTKAELKQLPAENQPSIGNARLSPDAIGPDTFAHYAGARRPDGSISAKKIEFEQYTLDAEEAAAWKLQAARVDYSNSRSGAGELTIDETEYELFPCPEAQEYLTKLGTSLIPPGKRDPTGKSPTKIQFRFFLVDTNTILAGVYPNGIVVVSAHVFDVLDNEAQLAFMLSHEMSRAVEKQAWRASKYRVGERTAVTLAGAAASLFTYGAASAFTIKAGHKITNDFFRQLETPADRVGLEYMLAAGYDPREAAEVWRTIARKHADRESRQFWANHDQNLTRRSYLDAELKLRHDKEDFSRLKQDNPEFESNVAAIKAARHAAKSKATS